MKSDKELTTEIVIAAINAKVRITNKEVANNDLPLTTADIVPLIQEVYNALQSLSGSKSE